MSPFLIPDPDASGSPAPESDDGQSSSNYTDLAQVRKGRAGREHKLALALHAWHGEAVVLSAPNNQLGRPVFLDLPADEAVNSYRACMLQPVKGQEPQYSMSSVKFESVLAKLRFSIEFGIAQVILSRRHSWYGIELLASHTGKQDARMILFYSTTMHTLLSDLHACSFQ